MGHKGLLIKECFDDQKVSRIAKYKSVTYNIIFEINLRKLENVRINAAFFNSYLRRYPVLMSNVCPVDSLLYHLLFHLFSFFGGWSPLPDTAFALVMRSFLMA